MQKIIIELPDGTRIGSGANATYAIKSHTITECVNSGTELTLGSACCACFEAHHDGHVLLQLPQRHPYLRQPRPSHGDPAGGIRL